MVMQRNINTRLHAAVDTDYFLSDMISDGRLTLPIPHTIPGDDHAGTAGSSIMQGPTFANCLLIRPTPKPCDNPYPSY